MRPLRWIAILGIFAFLGTFFWAFKNGDFWPQASAIASLEWGKVTLFDLYLGFVLFAGFVYLVERSILRALFWLMPTLALGNIIPFVYLLVREKKVVDRFRSKI